MAATNHGAASGAAGMAAAAGAAPGSAAPQQARKRQPKQFQFDQAWVKELAALNTWMHWVFIE